MTRTFNLCRRCGIQVEPSYGQPRTCRDCHRAENPLLQQAADMERDGITRNEIGRRLGISRTTVDKWLGPAPKTVAYLQRREQIPGLRARGWSYERMATYFGVSFETVKWDCHVLNKQKKQETAA